MNIEIFKYFFKTTFRNKSMLFWIVIFPFIMSIIFKFAFSNLDKMESEMVNMPIMVESKYAQYISEIKNNNGRKIFELKEYSNPQKALENDEIIGYVDKNMDIVVKDKEIESQVLYNIVGGVSHISEAINQLMKNPENRGKVEEILAEIQKDEVEFSPGFNLKNKKTTTMYFMSLLAMICLGSTTMGVVVVEMLNISGGMEYAKRLRSSPIPRMRLLLINLGAMISLSSIFSLIQYININLVLKIDFGNNHLEIILGIIVGNIMGLLIGMIIGLILKIDSNSKISISAIFYVSSSMFSGLMGMGIYGFVSNYIPITSYINPATVLSKMFSSLYLYEDRILYLNHLSNAMIINIFLFFLIALILRRDKNDSI